MSQSERALTAACVALVDNLEVPAYVPEQLAVAVAEEVLRDGPVRPWDAVTGNEGHDVSQEKRASDGRWTTGGEEAERSPLAEEQGEGKFGWQQLDKAAAKVEFTDEKWPVSDDDDEEPSEDEIEEGMDSNQRRDFEDAVTRAVDEEANDSAESYLDGNDGAYTGYLRETVFSEARDFVEDHVAEDKQEAVNEELDKAERASYKNGVDALDHVRDAVNSVDDAMTPELEERLAEYEKEIEKDLEEKQEEERESAYEDARNNVDEGEIRSNLLQEFYRNNREQYAKEETEGPQPNTWYKDGKDQMMQVVSSSGKRYEIASVARPSIGENYVEISFSDASGNYGVTGAEGPRGAADVFRKVSAGVLALVKKQDPSVITFTAYEDSRRRLYDRLVKTVAKSAPGYKAVAFEPPGTDKYTNHKPSKIYAVVKRDEYEGLYRRMQGKTKAEPQILVNRAEQDWFQPSAWEGGFSWVGGLCVNWVDYPQWNPITGNTFTPELHPHAPGGDSHGGQFISTHASLPAFEDLEHVKDLPGSTSPKLMKHKEHGKQWVIKTTNSKLTPDHLHNEEAANAVYRVLGIPVPHSGVITKPDGTVAKAGEYMEGGQQLADWEHGKSATEKQLMYKQIQKGFVADALLANWDVIGMSKDNIMIKDGVPYRVDQGGSLKYRAQGGLKGSKFGASVGELETLRNNGLNSASASVFKGITNAEIKSQVENVLQHKEEILNAIPDKSTRSIVESRLKDLDLQKDHGAFDNEPEPPKPPVRAKSLITPPSKLITPPGHLSQEAKDAAMEKANAEAYDVISGEPQHVPHLMNGEEVVSHLKKAAPGFFTKVQLAKMMHLNPVGTTAGVFYCPFVRVSSSKEKEVETNNKISAKLAQVLPKGTVIKKAHISVVGKKGVHVQKLFKKVSAVAGEYEGASAIFTKTEEHYEAPKGAVTDGASFKLKSKTETMPTGHNMVNFTEGEQKAIQSWKGQARPIRKQIAKGDLTGNALHFMSALEKCHKFSGTLFRGVYGEYASDRMKEFLENGVGSLWQDTAPMGTSRNVTTATEGAGSAELLFHITKAHDARMIEAYKGCEGEEECIVPFGSMFRITGLHKNPIINGKKGSANGKVKLLVQMEQLPGAEGFDYSKLSLTPEQIKEKLATLSNNAATEEEDLSPENSLDEMMDTAILMDKDGNITWIGKHVKLNPDGFETLAVATGEQA